MKASKSPRKILFTLLLTALLITGMTVGTLAAELISEQAVETAKMKPVGIQKNVLLESIKSTENLDGIVIQSLPDASAGQLLHGSRSVLRGEGIAAEALENLRFLPAAKGEIKASFTFVPVYTDGKTGELITYELTVSGRKNNKPVASDLSFETYRNIAVAGSFSAVDADGDTLTYKLTSEPRLGSVKFDSVDSTSFIYEPFQNKGGTDRFSYVAMDSEGSVSDAGEITVSIEKPDIKLTYSDMSGHKAHYAAIRLAENGVFTGRKISDSYYFEPDAMVSRGEFIAMAVALANTDDQPAAIRTSFTDDSDIPVWVKPFAVAAVKAGFVQGVQDGDALKLNASSPITRAEAAMILNSVSGAADAATMRVYVDEETIPAWAKQSVVNMDTLGIIKSMPDGTMALDSAVTRGEAAQMLENLISYQERTTKKTGLFSWIG